MEDGISMPRVTRAELLEENEQLWTTVESIYDELGELLGLDATSLRSLSDAPIARPVSSGRALQNGGSGESQTTAPRRRTARARYGMSPKGFVAFRSNFWISVFVLFFLI